MKKLTMAILLMSACAAMANEAETEDGKGGEARPERLDGLFGVKFGEAPDAKWAVKTNESCVLFVDYRPEKAFLSFADYALFATPMTKRTYWIRAVAPSLPEKSASSLVQSAMRLIELRFGGIASEIQGGRLLTFANADFIRVSQEDGRVVIDAVRPELMAVADQEAQAVRAALREAEEKSFAEDIRALQLILKTQAAGASNETLAVSSVLGRVFGESLTDLDHPERQADGTWMAQLSPAGKFLDCDLYEAFGSAVSKSVFRIRVARDGASTKSDFARLRRAVEIAFRAEMLQRDENELRCSLRIGNLLISISRDAERGRMSLDFCDADVVVRHEDELKTLPEKKFWLDIDAL